MNAINRELIYFDPDFTGEHGDFDGPCSPLNRAQQQDYLRRFAQLIRQSEGLGNTSQKVVSEEEVAAAVCAANYTTSPLRHTTRVDFLHMHAFSRPRAQTYAGWQLYTDRVRVCDGALLFEDGDLAPVPCAVYRFAGGATRLSFRFCIDPAYRAEIPGGILDQTTGRIVELRDGIRELVKLQLYSNGEFRARVVKGDPYHHDNRLVGRFAFGEWHTVHLTLREAAFDVELENGGKLVDLPYNGNGTPDTLFISGGMVPQGSWQFAPLSLQGGTTVSDFFVPSTGADSAETDLCEVSLPFAIGTHRNRDRELVLRTTFAAKAAARSVLHVEALDPGGTVYLNGEAIARADTFLALDIDVTDRLNRGENKLELVVNPRAPEVLYSWHRHADPYNGWFCLGAHLTQYQAVLVGEPTVITRSLDPAVTCDVTLPLRAEDGGTFVGTCRWLLKRAATDEEEQLLCEWPLSFVGETVQRGSLSFQAECWSPEAPCLYELRAVVCDQNGIALDDALIETGFRTIEQRDGAVYLNGKRTLLNGALVMQFLPPYEQIPVNHVCPSDEQIVWQALMTRRLNGNIMRLHQLGYGSNDPRFARLCDRLGIMLIWTTRCIDSIEGALWRCGWKQREAYQTQMRAVINHPAIVMWEGSNEFHPSLCDVDDIYNDFTRGVRAVDQSRLICPVSHLYYAGGVYDKEGCAYYNDAGTANQNGILCRAGEGWTDPLVVRSAHTYCLLLGYGTDWATMREQKWTSQPELFQSREHAYLVTEFAVIGMQDPTTPEAAAYIKTDSYELPDCGDLFEGVPATEQWVLSQAFQALCAKEDVKQLRLRDVDGMTWCCLSSGANDASYLKPTIDFYGYAKLGFYTLREGYQPVFTLQEDTDVVWGPGHAVKPVLVGDFENGRYDVEVTVADERGAEIEHRVFKVIRANHAVCPLPTFVPALTKSGYYTLTFTTKQLKEA